MRWIVVFLFLYFIPLIVLFKNYNNIKRSFIYASMYITLVTTIVITNIYISGLNKIKEAMYYQNYSFGKEYTEEKIINENKPVQDTSEIAKLEEIKVNAKNDSNNIVSENKEHDNKEVVNFDSKKMNKDGISNKIMNCYNVINVTLMSDIKKSTEESSANLDMIMLVIIIASGCLVVFYGNRPFYSSEINSSYLIFLGENSHFIRVYRSIL